MPYTYLCMLRTTLKAASVLALGLAPLISFAAATAQIGAYYPVDGTVGVGTRMSFSMITSGFTNPTYYLTDSFPGGATTRDIDAQGNFAYVPNNDDIGTHVITVLVTDTQGNTASASKSFQVIAPTITSNATNANTLQYGSTISFSLTTSGFSGPTFSVADSFLNSSVTDANLLGNTFTWTPQKKDIGTHTLTMTAKDNAGHVQSLTQKVTVTDLAGITLVSVVPGGTVGVGDAFSLVASTTGLSSPTVLVKDLFYNGATTTFAWDGAKLSWTPGRNDVGVHQFVFNASESSGRSTSATFSVTVVPYSVTPQAPITPVVATTTVSGTSQTQASTPASSAPRYTFTTYLAVGSSGAAVTELQKRLIALGYMTGSPTGYFGAMTKKALQAFQKAKGLEQVGYTGPGTRAALNK